MFWRANAHVTCYFADPAVVKDTVKGLEAPVTDPVLVQVRHPSGNVGSEGEPGE